MSEYPLAAYPLATEDGQIRLWLHHYGSSDNASGSLPAKAVLLLHGASANHGTFGVREGGLAEWLAATFDVWLLDWRGSSIVVDDRHNRLKRPELFNFNAAAQYDIRAALNEMGRHGVTPPVAAVGHCMGSGVLAEAIARKHVTRQDLDCVVLLTLGLFYETPLDSRMKSEERILDRLRAERLAIDPFVCVDPRVADATGKLQAPWPDELDRMYEDWPGRQFHSEEGEEHGERSEECRRVRHMCNRVSFMYGMPYHHGNLIDEIHGTPLIDPVLQDQFGSIPLHMYIHAAQNIRQRHATFYEDKELPDQVFISDAARTQFSHLDKVTLITGARNRLWHRNSIDLMYEWLTQGSFRLRRRVRKHILPTYGHQDLLWGKEATTDVYPIITEGLS